METIGNGIEKIKGIIEEIRPRYIARGGDIQFVDSIGKDVRIRPADFAGVDMLPAWTWSGSFRKESRLRYLGLKWS